MEAVGFEAAGVGPGTDFGAFFAEQHGEVALLAQRLCGTRDVAEEIAADAFAEAWRRWDELTAAAADRSAAMDEIVQRLVHERAGRPGRRARPAQHPEGEPDGARVRALLAERLTLIPSQDAPTVVMARITEPAADAAAKPPAAAWFRRPAPLGGAIAAVALVAVGAIAMSGSSGGGHPATGQAAVPLTRTDAIAPTAIATGSASASKAASLPAGPSPSAVTASSNTASPSPSASASPTAAVTTTLSAAATSPSAAAPSTSALVLAPASTSAAVTVSTSVQGATSTWTQLDMTVTVNQTLSAFTLTITVADCAGLSAAGAWDSGAGGQFSTTTTTHSDGSISYTFALGSSGQVNPAGISFAAQFVHAPGGWKAAADSYSLTAAVAGSGAADDVGGGF